ncbi:unnamed protein product, partial [Brenthis ino]
MVKNVKYSLFLIFLYHNLLTKAQKEKTTPETIFVETTTEAVTIITDIPQSDVELALNHDVGKYTTMVFNYINKQYETNIRYERCFDDYTKCLITQSVATPICAVNDPNERPDGFVTYNSYCDAYFDNCLRQMNDNMIIYAYCIMSMPKRPESKAQHH